MPVIAGNNWVRRSRSVPDAEWELTTEDHVVKIMQSSFPVFWEIHVYNMLYKGDVVSTPYAHYAYIVDNLDNNKLLTQ